jgi:hypothetical protein
VDKAIREVLEDARIMISTMDDIERDLGGNDPEERARYNSMIDRIDAVLAFNKV